MPSDVRIAVAAHKPYWAPADPMYVPVHVGAALSGERIPGFRRDDEGDGVSELNPHYCELTALYWAWRNLEAGHLGLVHYRRHFAGSGERGTMTSAEAAALLSRAPVVVPRARDYRIQTMYDHYGATFDAAHLDALLEAVAESCPRAVPALYRRLSSTRGHMFNMMVMRADLLGAYCSWMFPVVGRVAASFDLAAMPPFEARMPGRVSEYLLDAWLEAEGVPFVEAPVRDMEPVNWARKGGSFLAAKFLGRKYVASF